MESRGEEGLYRAEGLQAGARQPFVRDALALGACVKQ